MKLGIIYTHEEQIKVDNIVYILGQHDSEVFDAVFKNVLSNKDIMKVDIRQLLSIGFPFHKAYIKELNRPYDSKDLVTPTSDIINAILNYFDIVERPKTLKTELDRIWYEVQGFAKRNNIILPKENS